MRSKIKTKPAAVPTTRPHIARRNDEPSERRKPELTPIQQLVCDEVAHLLFVGGDEREIESLLYAVLGSATRRRLIADAERYTPTLESDVAAFVQRQLASRKAELLAGWRRYDATPAATPEPMTATDRIRDNVIQQLREEFDDFMPRAKPEEHRLLLDILITHANVNRGRTSLAHDLPLVVGITEAMGRPQGCVMVDETQLKTVEKYVQAL